MSLPGSYDFSLYAGDSDRLRFSFHEDDGAMTPVDLTGSTILLTAKYDRRDASPAFQLEAFFVDPTQGEFAFDIPSGYTKVLGYMSKEVVLWYDIQYQHINTTITITHGRLTVIPDVS